jgi:hypothetical protein
LASRAEISIMLVGYYRPFFFYFSDQLFFLFLLCLFYFYISSRNIDDNCYILMSIDDYDCCFDLDYSIDVDVDKIRLLLS